MSQKRVQVSPHDLVYERKFDTALRNTHGPIVKDRLQTATTSSLEDSVFLKASEKFWSQTALEVSNLVVNYNIFPEFLQKCLELQVVFTDQESLVSLSRITSLVLKMQLGWNASSLVMSDQKFISDYPLSVVSRIRGSKEIKCLHLVLQKLDQMVALMPRADRRKNRKETDAEYVTSVTEHAFYEIKEIGFKTFWSRNSCAISLDGIVWYLYPKNYLLMIHNKCADIMSIFMLLASYPEKTFGIADHDSIVRGFMKELMKLAIKYQSKYFRIAKVLEALVIAETLVEAEGSSNRKFLTTIVDDLIEDTGFDYDLSALKDYYTQATPALRHELGCLSKVMGHPFCDVKGGAESLYEKTTSVKNINMANVLDCVRHAKRSFIRSYLLKHRKWPLVEIEAGAPRRLTEACLRNTDPEHGSTVKTHGAVLLADYDYVTLQKVLEYDFLENFIPYIKDRTISLLRKRVVQKYLEKDCTRKPGEWKNTRLLLYYLLSPMDQLDHLWYIKEFERNGSEDLLNYLVIRIVPKEKELKEKARGFGCKTYEDRARTLVQEFNTAEFLNHYSDEHAMTLGEIPLLKKLNAYRNLASAYPGFKCIMLCVDASSWNNAFRHAAVAPVAGEVLDNVFGFRTFSKTHEAYENSFIYVPDIDQTYRWSGQMGGIEGLNQDTWVFVYIHQIKVCLKNFPYPYHILCKGDDLRVAVMIPPQVLETKTIDQLKFEILSDVSNIGATFGHTIKVEDSYASETYMAFSKTAFLRNVEQPQSFRKIQKCYGANNAFMNTLDDYIASSYSNAHSASKTSPSPVACYTVAVMWASYYLVNHPSYKDLTITQLTALLQVPNMLGGFPIIYLHNFFTRAQSDLLVPFVDLVKFSKVYFPQVSEQLMKFFKLPVMPSDQALTTLLMDPFGLPIRRPFGATVVLRSHVSKIIARKSKNEQIQELFEMKESGYQERFMACLRTANVYNAKIISALYSCTPEGIIASLLRKFESGRSVMDVIILHSSRNFSYYVLRKAAHQDRRLNLFRVQVITHGVEGSLSLWLHDFDEKCSTEIGQLIRNRLWGKPVEGVTQPSPHHMISLEHQETAGLNPHNIPNHFKFSTSHPSRIEKSGLLFSSGPYDPFIGATTGSGLGQPDHRFISNNIMTEKVHKLLDLLRWCSHSSLDGGVRIVSNLQEIVVQMLVDYTQQSLELLAPFMGEKIESRTTQHHVRAANFRQSIVPNTLSNIYTCCQGNSYSHMTVEYSGDHYRLNYLELYCFSVSLWALRCWCQLQFAPHGNYWASTPNCQFCMAPITETPIILQRTNVPRIRLVHFSQIGKMGLRKILKELEDYEPPQYYTGERVEEITYSRAVRALVQSYVYASWTSRQRLQCFYTAHHLTARGHEVLRQWSQSSGTSGFDATDLEQASPEIILAESAHLVMQYIYATLKTPDPHTILSQLRIVPAEELPWYQMLSDLQMVNRLYPLQHYLAGVHPELHIATFDHCRAYAPVFGACCFRTAYSSYQPSEIVLLSPLDNESAVEELTSKMDDRAWHCIRRYFVHITFQSREIDNPILEVYHKALLLIACLCLNWKERLEENPEFVDRDLLMTGEPQIVDLLEDPVLLQARARQSLNVYTTKEGEYPGFMSRLTTEYMSNWSHVMQTIMHNQGMPDPDAPEIRLSNQDLLVRMHRIAGDQHVSVWKSTKVECINRVRQGAQPREIPGLEGIISQASCPALRVSGRNHMKQGLRIGPCHPSTADSLVENITWDDVDEEAGVTPFNSRWRSRPFGKGNISMSKACALLGELGLSRLPDHGLYVCLGDGYGGTSAVISSSTHNSTIVFNALPSNIRGQQQYIIPLAAEDISTMNNNVVDTSSMVNDMYDLCSQSVAVHLTQRLSNITMITCDAELVNRAYNTPERHSMCRTVLELFLAKGSPQCVLILKMYAFEVHNIIHAVGRVMPHCTSVWLKCVDQSAMNGELYLIAQLGLTNDSTNPLFPSWRPGPAVIGLIQRFCNKMRDRAINDPEDLVELVPITRQPTYFVDKKDILPPLGWGKIQEVTGLTVPLALMRHSIPVHSEWCETIRESIRPFLTQLISEFQGTSIARDRSFSLYNTLAHKILIGLTKLILLAGFSSAFRNRAGGAIREEEECMDLRVLLREQLPEDVLESWLPLIDLDREYSYGGYKLNPYRIWWQGLRWGVYARTYSSLHNMNR